MKRNWKNFLTGKIWQAGRYAGPNAGDADGRNAGDADAGDAAAWDAGHADGDAELRDADARPAVPSSVTYLHIASRKKHL